MPTRNSELLASFVAYCEAHPQQRFWQALKNWSGIIFIYAAKTPPRVEGSAKIWRIGDNIRDTFYWEKKDAP